MPRPSPSRLLLVRACALCLSGVCLLHGCGREPAPSSRPLVAVSVLPQRYFVERLAGDRVEVAVMIPPGANPAQYEPTLAQRTALARARLYVRVGHPHFPFERAWLDRLLDEGVRVVGLVGDAGRQTEDPHVWVSPPHVLEASGRLADALADLLPGDRPLLARNLADFRAEIEQLDRDLARLLAPARGRRFLVLHPAWGHLADAYGLRQVAVEHEGKAPGPRALGRLITEARTAGFDTLFVQPQFSRQAAQVVADEIGARVEVLDPLSADWPANLRHVAQQVARAARP